MGKAFAVLLVAVGLYVLSWAGTVGLFWIVCKLVNWEFSIALATAIWIGLCVLKSIFGHKRK